MTYNVFSGTLTPTQFNSMVQVFVQARCRLFHPVSSVNKAQDGTPRTVPQPSEITYWPHPFLIHHQTPDGKTMWNARFCRLFDTITPLLALVFYAACSLQPRLSHTVLEFKLT